MIPAPTHESDIAKAPQQAALEATPDHAHADANTTFTNQGAIPAPSAFGGGTKPTASEQAFGGTDHLNPDQRSYMDQIHQSDPGMTDKRANEVAKESRPLTQSDRDAVTAVQRRIATMKPRRIDDPKNPNLVQLEIDFDGSGDDREQMSPSTETNPARLDAASRDEKHYEPGVSTNPHNGFINNVADSFEMATGAGFQNRINSAYNNLVDQINTIKSGNPKAEVVLVLTGFSRGAAEARAFVNELNKRGVPVRDKPGEHYDTPKVGVMVLFDTVEMNPNPAHDMAIAPNVENVLHITARDEHRTTFPLTRATDPKRPNDNRITEVALPGSHGDIGGGFPNAYSQIPEQIARQYMINAGVNMAPEDHPVDVNDPSLRLHDSGDGLFGMQRPVFNSHNPDPNAGPQRQ